MSHLENVCHGISVDLCTRKKKLKKRGVSQKWDVRNLLRLRLSKCKNINNKATLWHVSKETRKRMSVWYNPIHPSIYPSIVNEMWGKWSRSTNTEICTCAQPELSDLHEEVPWPSQPSIKASDSHGWCRGGKKKWREDLNHRKVSRWARCPYLEERRRFLLHKTHEWTPTAQSHTCLEHIAMMLT